MGKNWNDVKSEPHNASGIEKPEDWTWIDNPQTGVYYPYQKIVVKPINQSPRPWEVGGEKSRKSK